MRRFGTLSRFPALISLLDCVQGLLPRFLIRVHRSEIMLGVLVIILRPNRVADLGFSAGQREILFIVSLRVLRARRLGPCDTGCPPPRRCSKRRFRHGLAGTHDCLWAILYSSLLSGCRQMRHAKDHRSGVDWFSRSDGTHRITPEIDELSVRHNPNAGKPVVLYPRHAHCPCI
jgi:hypothetical protein